MRYRLIPKGTSVFSIALQENIIFEKDMIVQNDGQGFGKLMMILFNALGCIPGITTKTNGDISFDIKKSKPYTVSKPQFFTYNYKDTSINNNKK